MADNSFTALSDGLADAVARAGSSVVQVLGRRQPASGIVVEPDLIVTSLAALGREEGLEIRTPDGRSIDAELAGWDPSTAIALLRASGVGVAPARISESQPRVGHLALALGRSRSNVLTATIGLVSVIGGPLPTGHGSSIERVIRTSAPTHGGFSGGAFVDTEGRLLGMCTAFRIRGLSVVVPADLVGPAARRLAEHGTPKRGYLGVAAQTIELPAALRQQPDDDRALIVVNVAAESPAERGGVLVGDIIIAMDGTRVRTPVDLLRMLDSSSVGRQAIYRIARAGVVQDLAVLTGERTGR